MILFLFLSRVTTRAGQVRGGAKPCSIFVFVSLSLRFASENPPSANSHSEERVRQRSGRLAYHPATERPATACLSLSLCEVTRALPAIFLRLLGLVQSRPCLNRRFEYLPFSGLLGWFLCLDIQLLHGFKLFHFVHRFQNCFYFCSAVWYGSWQKPRQLHLLRIRHFDSFWCLRLSDVIYSRICLWR